MLEGKRLFAAVRLRDFQGFRVEEFGEPLDVVDLPGLGKLARAGREPFHDVVLELTQLVEIDLGSPNSTPHAFACLDSSMSFATWSSAFDGIQPR